MSVEQNVARTHANHAAAEAVAELLMETVADMGAEFDRKAFWTRFDALTADARPTPEQAPPKSITRAVPSVSGDEDADELFDEIADLLDQVPDEGGDFASGVKETTDSIAEWAEEHEVTPKQMQALANMRDGLKRWVNGGRDRD